MDTWSAYAKELYEKLQGIEFTDGDNHSLSIEEGFALWANLSNEIHIYNRSIFFVGNGASSTMSSHFATDVGKNARLRTQVFTDAALMTALGNDLAFDQVFAEPLSRFAQKGDMLVAISSSGNSPNIVEAVRTATVAGLVIVTLSGMNGDNCIRSMGDLNCWVNGDTYGVVETSHAAILHYWTNHLVTRYGAPS